MIRSNFDKVFCYFIPSNLGKKLEDTNKKSKQMAFYWINDGQKLVTCVSK